MSKFDIRLRQFTASGTRGAVIPTITLQLDQVFGDTMSANVKLSAVAYEKLPAFPVVAAVEFSNGSSWVEVSNSRMIFQEEDTDAVDPAGIRTLTGVSFVSWMLSRAVLQNSSSAKNGSRLWSPGGATPGQIVSGMMLEAHNRGWGSGITTNAGITKDSGGKSWVADDLEISYNMGTPIWEALTALTAQGVCEFVTIGNRLRVYNPGGHGTDWTTGSTIVRLSHGASSVPVKKSYAPILTNITVAGAKDLLVNISNSGAPKTFGRLEGWVESSGIGKASTAKTLAKKTLAQAASGTKEIQVRSDAHEMTNLPWVTYGISDWVLVRAGGGWEKGRVVELVVDKDQDGKVSISTIIGDRNQTLLARLAHKSVSSSNGKSGGTGKSVIPKAAPPVAPTSLVGTSVGYWDSKGAPKARVTLSWDAVTEAEDGEPAVVNQYRVWWRLDSEIKSKTLSSVNDATFIIDDLPVGSTRVFTVQARNDEGTWGQRSSGAVVDLDAPTALLDAPSDPIVLVSREGALARWDGKLGATTPPVQFDHVYAATSATETGSYTPVGSPLSGAGTISLNMPTDSAIWVHLVAVDVLGRESSPSNAVQVAGQPETPSSLTVSSNVGGWSATGHPVADVTVTWGAVVKDILGNTLACDRYEVWTQADGSSPLALHSTVEDPTVSTTLPSAVPVDFLIRARSLSGYWSALTAPFTVTPATPVDQLEAPSGPSLVTRLGVIVATWDGLLSGLTPPDNFSHLIVETAATEAGSYTQDGEELYGAGGVILTGYGIDSDVWVRFVPYTVMGTRGAESDPVMVTVQGVTGPDIEAGTVTANNIEAGTLTVNELSPTIGDDILISGNVDIQTIVQRQDDTDSNLDDTNSTLDQLGQRVRIDGGGITISEPGAPVQFSITNDRAALLENGVEVSWWNSGQMHVPSMAVTELVFTKHKFSSQTGRTIVKAIN